MFFNENKYIIENPNRIFTESMDDIFPPLNNQSILQEGFFNDKWDTVKKYFRFFYQEFLRYLDKVIDVWVNIQARFKSWNFDAEAAKKKVRSKFITISKGNRNVLDMGMKIAANSTTLKEITDKLYDLIIDGLDDNDYTYNIDTIDAEKFKGKEVEWLFKEHPLEYDSEKDNDEKLDFNDYNEDKIEEADISKYVNFIKDGRVTAIKTLQYIRNKLAKAFNKLIKYEDLDNDESKEIARFSAKFRRVINRFIDMINRATNAVINAIAKIKKTEEAEKLISGKPIGKAIGANDIINKFFTKSMDLLFAASKNIDITANELELSILSNTTYQKVKIL